MARGSRTRAARRAARRERFGQLRAAFQLTRRNDPRLVPYLLAALLGPVLLGVVVGLLVGQLWYLAVMGLLVGLTAAMLIFSRRATSAAFAQVEGQPGAAAAVLQSLRGDWRVTPAVAVTGSQDMVHRVVGRPGVVLVAEGPSRRVGALLGQEKRRVGRVVGDTPVYDIVVGDEAGQIALRKVQQYFMKLPRNLTPKQVNALDKRLQALGGMNVPLPKGPLPKGARLPRGAKQPPGGAPRR